MAKLEHPNDIGSSLLKVPKDAPLAIVALKDGETAEPIMINDADLLFT
jgi:hypothetical protein